MSVTQMIETVSHFFITHIKQITISVLVVVLCAGLFIIYILWSMHRDTVAQRAFGPLIDVYTTTMGDKDAQWDEFIKKCDQEYKNNARSHMAPYFLAYQAQALIEQNKKSEALAILDTIVNTYNDIPLLHLYKTMRALIKLDMPEQTVQKTGQDELVALAYNKKNQFRDTALFYLGRYYWVHDDVEQARNVWQDLVNEQQDERTMPSAWLDQAQEYLKITVV